MLTRVKYPTLASICLTESHTALRTNGSVRYCQYTSRFQRIHRRREKDAANPTELYSYALNAFLE
ncbi:hypothetical protein C5K15_24105 [Shigella dysenteriae]|uniref:Uncharacterized protein n=1 Tax=Shigella dysenteriae TaxID=622 RepID=A0A2S8D6C1_SHIDY|nr:hypothetical protein C5K18_24855 [Shigella dysenteriae]PQN97871.1 hypothetical protein C5K15_24105 [Shigella dysenteriae]